MKMKARYFGVVAILIGASSFSARASSYDAAADFLATSTNPNGVWSYGQYSGLDPTTFSAFQFRIQGTLSYQDIYQWSNAAAPADPNVDFNSGGDVTGSGVDFQPNKLTLGPYGGPAVVRFVAPSAGLYDISATFTTVQTVNSDPNAYVFVGSGLIPAANTLLSDPSNDQIGDPWTYSASHIFLAANENVDFVVWGGNSANKTTQLDATITAVPLPASVGEISGMLIGFGALFGVRKGLKRRSRIA